MRIEIERDAPERIRREGCEDWIRETNRGGGPLNADGVVVHCANNVDRDACAAFLQLHDAPYPLSASAIAGERARHARERRRRSVAATVELQAAVVSQSNR